WVDISSLKCRPSFGKPHQPHPINNVPFGPRATSNPSVTIFMYMTNAHAMRRFHFLVALMVLCLDRISKWYVAKDIALHDTIKVINNIFYITHVENRGAAFSLFADSPSQWKMGMLVLFS